MGLLRPNDLGLFDTLGNALEWCEDGWNDNTPATFEDGENPKHATADERINRVLRGGSFAVPVGFVRSGSRTTFVPSNRNISSGIRLARTMPE